ncbi:unnamed protein product [marine sediment metagenome]|uniref:Uncharacterized protein n=1 Tax=marine sediment metagenome TaxID=412755 RepID=X0RZN9_9ZZZZ
MAKGSDWEREASKMLSLWWTEGERDDVIWRTAASGGRATVRSKVGKNTANACGDLCYTDRIAKPLFDFMLIECKRGYAKAQPSGSINVLYWLDRPTNTKPPLLYQWWHKLKEECRAAGAHYGAIIFRRTGKRACIMLEYHLFSTMAQYCKPYTGMDITISTPHETHPWPEEEYVILDLERFLAWCSPQTITLMLEDLGGAKQHQTRTLRR